VRVDSGGGVWTSLLHLRVEGIPLDFARIFPSQIVDRFQGRVPGLSVSVRDGRGRLRVELRDAAGTRVWSDTRELAGGRRTLDFNLPACSAYPSLCRTTPP